MPTYQYACTACPERLEVVQKFTDDPMTECPSCTGLLRKVFSAVGVVFKGSGFYKTDSRAKPSSSSSSASSSSESSTGASTSTSSSSESAAPAAAKPPSTGNGSTGTAAAS